MTETIQKAKQMLSDIYNDPEAFPRPDSSTITVFDALVRMSSPGKPISVNDMAVSSLSSAQTTMRRSLNELAYALKDLDLGLELKRVRPSGKGKAYYYWLEQN